MGKRMQRHSVHHERQHLGCMSGLISIFDFRQSSSTPKLLWNRRNGNSRHAVGIGYSRSRFKLLTDFDRKSEGSNDGGESKTSKINTSKTSVKKLMEEEMSGEQQPKKRIRGAAAEKIKPEQEHGCLEKKQNCASKVERDPKASSSLDSQESYLDLAALMEEFCSQIHQRQEMHLQHENEGEPLDGQNSVSSVSLDQLDELDMQLVHKHSILEEKLGEAAEAFLNKKFINAKQLTRHGEICQSKQFTDALEILNSNRDLILKLLDDSNSLLVKHIQDLRDAQSEKLKPKKSLAGAKLSDEEIIKSKECQEPVHHKQFQKQNMHNFFWRIVKSQSKSAQKESDSPPGSNRIVVLKPNPAVIQNSAATTSPRSSTQFHYGMTKQDQGSRFSLREIKKKLKQIMGESRKEHRRISMDGILHKIPSECQTSGHGGKVISGEIAGEELPSKTRIHLKKASKPSTSGRSEDKTGDGTDSQPRTGNNEVTATTTDGSKSITVEATGHKQHREPNIYSEAKKQLSDMVSTVDEDLDSAINQVPETLESILALPECISSPIFSPGRDIDHTFVTAQMRFSFSDNFGIVSENVWKPKQGNIASLLSPFRQDLETELHINDEIKLQALDLNPDISEELHPENVVKDSMLSSKADLSPKGEMDILEITESEFLKESDFLDPSETNSSTITSRSNTRIDLSEMWEDGGSSKCSSLDSPMRDEPSSLASLSSKSSFIQENEAVESINDRPERPSPVSVLQPFFLEDATSPEITKSQPAELQIQPRQIHFEETDSSDVVIALSDRELYIKTCVEDKKPTFEYVRAVLEASGLSWDEFSTTYQCSDQPLDPSLFDEVEILSTEVCSDPMLLFDCINEVLLELYEHYFGCPPWVTFVKSNIRPVPVGNNSIIREVWEGIDWHLIPPPLPCTLDDIIGKDMAKTGTWMNLQFDIEVIGIQIEEAILKELIEDTIFNLCT